MRNTMKFRYKDQIVTASSKNEAVNRIKLLKKDKDYIFKKAENGDTSIFKLPKEALMIQDENGETPTHYIACQLHKKLLSIPKELLMVKANNGNTPVHVIALHASRYNDKLLVLQLSKELLKIKDNEGDTPVHDLAYTGVDEIRKLTKELLSIKNNDGDTPLDILRLANYPRK